MMPDHWTLQGKTALVTGGTKGIGRAIAEELLSLGAEVCIVARTAEDVDQRVGSWRELGWRAHGIAADVSSPAGRLTILERLKHDFDCLHTLVNNAGLNIRKRVHDYIPKEYAQLMDTNVTAVFELCRVTYPLFKKRAGGSIVNIGSVAGHVPVGTTAVYGMSKASVFQLTRSLAKEWGPDGIRVNTVSPWFTRTDRTEPLLANEEFSRAVLARTPLGRIGEPKDIAGLVAFLCLPSASFITGQCIAVDGGFLASGFST